MIHRFLRLVAVVLFVPLCLVAAPADESAAHRPRITPLPAWFTPAAEFDLAAESQRPLTADDAHHELSYYVYDQQTLVAEQATTTHYAYRITSDAGLSDGAQLSQRFDPSYAALELHLIRIWRDGVAEDRLKLDEIKVIQQERDLERQLFNGELSAITTLADVRKGDIVECAFTVRGMNPVFAGKFIDTTSLAWGSPVAFERVRVVMPPERPLHWRILGDIEPTHTVGTNTDGAADHSWIFRRVAPIHADGDTPSWHVRYPYLSVSEFTDWEAVRAWALPIYASSRDDPILREKALALTAGAKTPEQKVLALLDFVQREVRYLGVELGANSHRPHPPAQVLRQRFGDCKDKVTLFCALLAEVGIPAYPALVNTYRRHAVAQSLPSPYAFNHVIALVPLDGESYWLDPTALHDRGDLKQRDATTESRGLAVRADAAPGLQLIPERPQTRRRLEVTQEFSYEQPDQPAKLAVTYRYHGESAYGMRSYLASRTKEQVTRDFLDKQKRAFPALTLASPLTWRDDAERNIIELDLQCTVPELWQIQAGKTERTAEFYPWDLQNTIAQPDSLTRTAPLELTHPWEITVRTNVHLRGTWNLEPDDKTIETPRYHFHMESHFKDQVFRIVYSWQSRTDHVPAAEVSKHVAELARIRKEVGYTLRHGTEPTPASPAAPAASAATDTPAADTSFALNWRSVLLVVVLLAAWTKFALWLYRLPVDPAPPSVHAELRGIGGWLILPAISLVIRPFTMLYTFSTTANAYFNARVWENLATPGLASYRPGFISLLVFELAGNTSAIALTVIAAVFFFRTKRHAPKLMIALLVGMAALHVIDTIGNHWVGNSDSETSIQTASNLIGVIVPVLIWVPYFLVSRRVKATFVN